jgi:hypothetical protein
MYHFPTIKREPVLWHNWTAWEDIMVDIRPVGKCPKPLTIAESLYWTKFGQKNLTEKIGVQPG